MTYQFMHSDSGGLNVQWEMMFPYNFRKNLEKLPTVFLPLGTVEWHGEHNALGLDALKAQALCVMAARQAEGGIVHPPLYGGMGGLDKPATVVIEGEYAWDYLVVRPMLERLCGEFHRIGFKAIIMLTGHYGHNQQIMVKETAIRMSERLRIPVIGMPEYLFACDAGYLGDHAGIGETSLMLYLYPELADLSRIDDDPDYGADDKIKAGSAKELGKKYASLIIKRLASLATKLPGWDENKLDQYIKAERDILAIQVKGWRTKSPWAAWDKMFSGAIVDYGRLLSEEKFTEISDLAKRLL